MSSQLQSEWTSWLAEVKRERSRTVEAETDFFTVLAGGEPRVAMWKEGAGAGYETFAAVLEGEDICRPRRFEAFKAAVARFGLGPVRSCGFESTRLVLAVPEGQRSRDKTCDVDAATATLSDFESFRVRNGVPPSTQQARAILRKHWEPEPRRRAPPGTPEHRIEELEEENAALRKERAALQKENAHLRAQLDQLNASARVASKTRPPLAATKKHPRPRTSRERQASA